ncbi:MAG: cytochrome c maturation protein CcmE [Nitrospirae bacterium]|nr:cytochrome c maturation protein CcmE [Nitrospirota bacterium]
MTNGRKIGIIASVLVVAGALGYLALGNFGKNLVYFYTPSEVTALSADHFGKKVRVGGMVVQGSVQVVPNTLQMKFDLTDGAKTIPVAFEGIPPDLFKEGTGAVVEGYWDDGKVFHSNMIMAKHSEDYMPIEMKRAGVEFPKKDLLKTLQQ